MTAMTVAAVCVQIGRANLLTGAGVRFAAGQPRLAVGQTAEAGRAHATVRSDQVDAFHRVLAARRRHEAFVDVFAAALADESRRTYALITAVRLLALRSVRARIRRAIDGRRRYAIGARLALIARLTDAYKARGVGEREFPFHFACKHRIWDMGRI